MARYRNEKNVVNNEHHYDDEIKLKTANGPIVLMWKELQKPASAKGQTI